MTPVAIPDRLQKRPMYGGLPVPFIVLFKEGEAPKFSFNSHDLVMEAAEGKLCSVCGEPLEYWVAFVGGPDFFVSRCFGEPGMHEECARYALAVCPHLLIGRVRTNKTVPLGTTILHHEGEGKPASEAWCLYITRNYQVRSKNGVPVFKVGNPARVHWFRGGVEIDEAPPLPNLRKKRTPLGVVVEQG